MSEKEFWQALRLRINTCAELSNLGYCDWLEPRRYLLGPPEPRIEGRAGFLGGASPGEFEFSIALPRDCHDLGNVDWRRLVPAPGITGWTSVENGWIFLNVVGE